MFSAQLLSALMNMWIYVTEKLHYAQYYAEGHKKLPNSTMTDKTIAHI